MTTQIGRYLYKNFHFIGCCKFVDILGAFLKKGHAFYAFIVHDDQLFNASNNVNIFFV